MADDQASAMAELSQAIAADILGQPDLSDPDWDTYSMVAEVSDDRTAVTAYRYTQSGPPVPAHGPDDHDLFHDLRERTRGVDGEAWDVVLVKIHRETANLVMNFVAGDGADLWRVKPSNMDRLPEALRPRPEDFAPTLPDEPQGEIALAAEPGPSAASTAAATTSAATTSTSLVVEVLADGGIRVTSLEGRTGLASSRATLDWVEEANRTGAPVHLRGNLTAPRALAVVEEVRRLATSLDETSTDPAPWPKGFSSLQTAAFNGLVEQATDLLDRGAPPTVGRGRTSPYRLAMQHGHLDVLVALRAAGARPPSGPAAPAELPDAVVLRAYPPRWIWWVIVPFALAAGASVFAGVYWVGLLLLAIPLGGIGAVHFALGNTMCAIDGPLVARRRGRRWQGPVDLRALDALGFTPPGTVRMPLLWVLGQRQAGDGPDIYSRSAFDAEQWATLARIEDLRFVPLYAANGFLSPGFERHLARHVDRSHVVVGPFAEQRVWGLRP